MIEYELVKQEGVDLEATHETPGAWKKRIERSLADYDAKRNQRIANLESLDQGGQQWDRRDLNPNLPTWIPFKDATKDLIGPDSDRMYTDTRLPLALPGSRGRQFIPTKTPRHLFSGGDEGMYNRELGNRQSAIHEKENRHGYVSRFPVIERKPLLGKYNPFWGDKPWPTRKTYKERETYAPQKLDSKEHPMLHMQKATASSENDDRGSLKNFIKFMKNEEPTAVGAGDDDEMSEEEMREIMRRIQEDMTDSDAPQVSYEDVPEENRPNIDAFKDAFDEEIENSLTIFKRVLIEKDDGLRDWLKRKFGQKKEDIPQGKPYFRSEDADLEEEAKRQAARWEEIKSRDPNTWEERWKPGYMSPSPRWHKAGFSSHKEWQEAGSPEPKPKYTPKGRGRPWNKLTDEERTKRDLAQPNLSMSSIEDKLTKKDLEHLEALKNLNSEAPSKGIADDDPRLTAARKIIARINRGHEQPEKKLTRSELLQQLVEEEKREWQAMKDVAREEDAKAHGNTIPIPPRGVKAGDAIARERDMGGSFHEQAMEAGAEPSLIDLLDEHEDPFRSRGNELNMQSPNLGRISRIDPDLEAGRKPYQERLARLMEPEKRPVSEGLIANKLYKAFGIGG